MRLKHESKMYPPRVMMTVTAVNTAPFKLNVKVSGCSSEDQLDRDITFPLLGTATFKLPFNYSHHVICDTETAHSTSAVAQLRSLSHTVITRG
jgi:hypothetical protein